MESQVRQRLIVGITLTVMGIAFLTTSGQCDVFDGKSVDINLSTGVTNSQHFVRESNGLVMHPPCPGCSWKNEWVLSKPISLDDWFRLPRKVSTVMMLDVSRSSAAVANPYYSPINIYERFSVNQSNWSTWQAMTRKNRSGNSERFELALEIPAYDYQAYMDMIPDFKTQKDQKNLLAIPQIIMEKDPHWFETHIPLIRFVQFLIDVPNPNTDIVIHRWGIDLRWSTNQRRENFWFDNDPVELRRRRAIEQNVAQTSKSETAVFGLDISCESPINILVRDTEGHKTGWEKNLENRLQEIPHSAAGIDEIDDARTGEAGQPSQTILIQQIAPSSTFSLEVTGGQENTYNCSLHASGDHLLKGTISKGQKTCYELRFDAHAGLIVSKPNLTGHCN